MALNIDGPTMGKLSAAIASAFPAPPILTPVLSAKLDDNIANYAGLYTSDYPTIRFNLIQAYNARYHIDKLVAALLEENPTNEPLLEFAWRHGIVKRPPGSNGRAAPDDDSLERVLDPVRGFTDPMAFMRRFGEIVRCVCHISVPADGGAYGGTGLLVGDETVLTNYHVVESLVEQTRGADRKDVRLLFDFHTGPDGQTISGGVEYKLVDDAAGWLIASRPYHPDDLRARPVDQNLAATRPDDDLDFALLRIAGKPGAQPIGRKPGPNAPLRGHVKLPADAAGRFATDFEKGSSALFVFQHPDGKPLQLDWEKPAVLGANANATRVLYDVNTQPGSSGSPCFNAKLELAALHHAGGKDWPAEGNYRYNQGIPIAKIYSHLQRPQPGGRDLLAQIR